MTDKTEAQPEALRLAYELLARVKQTETGIRFDGALAYSAAELRRQHAEIQQLKAQNAHLRDALSDIASGEIMRSHCVGPHCTEELGIATADELSSRAAGALNWDDLVAQPSTDVGIPMLAQLSARQAAPSTASANAACAASRRNGYADPLCVGREP